MKELFLQGGGGSKTKNNPLFLIIFTPRITFFAISMNVLPDLQSAQRWALWGFVIGGRGSIISVFSSFWGMRKELSMESQLGLARSFGMINF